MKKSKLIKIKEIIYRSIVTFLIAFLSIGLVHTQPVFAATQTLGGRTVEGDLLITVQDSGQMDVKRYVAAAPEPWQNQIFAGSAKGSRLQFGSNSYGFGYYSGNSSPTFKSNTKSGNTITTSWDAGSVNIVQKTTYTEGNAYYRLEWTITNTGSSSLNDLRFFHGEDTYLSGGDNGGGFWDSVNNSIGVKKTISGSEQRLVLQGITTPYAYESQNYSLVRNNVNNGGLTGAIDPNEATDNGYALEWRTASLSAGSSWTIVAFEKFNNATVGGLNVTAPVSVECNAGTTCEMNFSVANQSPNSATVNLSVSGTQSWGQTIVGSNPRTISGNSSAVVTVSVSVPSGTSGGTTANFALTANDGTGNYSDTGGIYVSAPPVIETITITAVYPNFESSSSLSAFNLAGDATHNSGANSIKLTPDQLTKFGAAWWNTPVHLGNNRSFSSHFSFLMTGGDSTPADGITFAIQTQSNNAGSSGGGLGYEGITPSFAVEFDTYHNPDKGDPDNKHIGINVNGSVNSKWTKSNMSLRESVKYVWVDYNGSTDILQIRFGSTNNRNNAELIYDATFASINGGTPLYNVVGANVFVGFTAATGGSRQEHHIKSFYFNNDYIDQGINPGSDTKIYIAYPAIVTLTQPTPPVYTGSSPSLTVCTKDSTGNAYPNQEVTISTTSGLSASASSVTTGGNGCGSFTITAATSGTYTVTVQAPGGVTNSATVNFEGNPPTTFIGSPPNGTYGAGYNYQFSTNGNPTPTFNKTSGTLPPGLTLSSTGVLSGTPTEPGTYNFEVKAENVIGSKTQNFSVTINKAGSVTSITNIVRSPSVYGENYTITVQVNTTTIGTPSGTVSVSDGTNSCSPVMSLVSGGGSCVLPSTSASTTPKTITASYGGNTYFLTSSSTQPHTVDKQDTTTSVISSSPTSVYGQPFYLTATVAEVFPSLVTPVGQVQFYFEGSAVGSPVTLVNGVATSADLHSIVPSGYLLANHIKVGGYSFSASYLGNSNSETSVSSVGTQTINPAATELTIASSQNPSLYGTALDMTITVTQETVSETTPTGTVKLYIDGVEFKPTLTLGSDGQVTRTIPYYNLWPGEHAITAYYTPSSPAQFIASNNADGNEPLIQIVNKADTSFEISSDVANPVASQAVKLSVQLTHPTQSAVIPTGIVQFFDGDNPISGEIELDEDGFAEMTQAVRLSAGEHSITVRYSGDEYFKSVLNSTPEVMEIAKANTSTEILSAIPFEDVVVGQPVTVSVVVSVVAPAVETPAGHVVVSNGTDECTATLDTAGQGSCELVATSTGAKTLTATYQGSMNHNGSTSESYSGLEIGQATSSVTITGFSHQPFVGEGVVIYFTVDPQYPDSIDPTGVVRIYDEFDTLLCTDDLGKGGEGSCTLAFDYVGPTSIKAFYKGNGNYLEDWSPAYTAIEVKKANTTLILSTSVTPSVYGQNVTFTADVGVDAPASVVMSGKVQFFIDNVEFGAPVNLISGNATSNSIKTLPVGNHSISAQYLESDLIEASDIETITQVVDKAYTTITLDSDQNPSPYGVPVLVTATVEGVDPSQLHPTSGTVQFIVDGVYYGAPVPLNADGQASKLLPHTALWVGTHPITAIYSGDDTSFHGSNNHATTYEQVVEKGVGINLDYSFGESSPVYGQSFTVTASLEADNINNPHPLPTGTIQFFVNGAPLGSAISIGESLSATSNPISGMGVGSHALKVVYSGDEYYTSREVQTNISVVKSPSSVNIIGFTPETVVVGQSVTVNFAVAAATPGSGTPTGTVTVSFGSDSCSGVLTAGSGSCVLKPLSSRTGKISAAYQGDDNFTGSDIFTVSNLVVGKASINLSITDDFSDLSYVVGQPYSVTVNVTPVGPGTLIPVGASITISNGMGESCNATIAQDGTATCQITPNAVEAQTLTASFAGNADFNLANSSEVTGPNINKADTTVSILSVTPNPSVYDNGYDVTVQVGVEEPGSGTPSGSVKVLVKDEDEEGDGTIACTVTLSEGSTCTITATVPGKFELTAEYEGNSNYNSSSTSQATKHTVNKAASTTTITANTPATSAYGASYLVEVAVSSNTSATPSGMVAVSDGTNHCDIDTLVNGVGSCPLPSTSVGEVTITAVYSGDTYLESSQDTQSHTVNQANTTITLESITPEPSVYGQEYVVNVQVNSSTSGTPTGTVTISDGFDSCQDIDLVDGSTTCKMTSLGVGDDVKVTVDYSGDEFFVESSKDFSHSIVKADTTTTITDITRSPSVYGEKISLSVEVEPAYTGTPTGTVTVRDESDFSNECTIDLSSESSCELMSTDAAELTKSITASYAGDGNFNSSSDTATHRVDKAATSISLTSSTDGESVYGQPFYLTATVTQEEESEKTPDGQVQFYYLNESDKVAFGATVDLVDGKVSNPEFTTVFGDHLQEGQYQFSAEYVGNSNFIGSESLAFTQTIVPAPTILSITSSESTSEYGTTLDFTITVKQQDESLVTPTGMVQLSIDGVKFMSPMALDGEGKAVRTVPYLNLWPGIHDITAKFIPANSAHFVASDNTASPFVQTVLKATPVITISPNVDEPVASQLVGFEVQVSHSFRAEVIPSGLVQFFVDGVALGDPVQLNSQGKAQSPEALRLDAGNYDVTVSYAGDEYFQVVEESEPNTLTIAKADTVVEITNVEPLSVVVGQETEIFVKVSVLEPAIMMPYGKVEVQAGSESCEATLDANGEGSCVIATDSTGEIEITALFMGSDDHNPSEIATYSSILSVAKANSAVSISGFSPAEPVVGQPVEIFFNVVPVAPGWGTPTGMVTMSSGETYQCQSELVMDKDGTSKGSCEITFLKAGNPVLKADYVGDDNFEGSTFENYADLVISKAHTSLALSSSQSPSVFGQSVQFTAKIRVNEPGAGTPSGSVQFYIDDSEFGDPVVLDAGIATSGSINDLAIGDHSIRATYSGDDDYETSNDTFEQEVVQADSVITLTSSQNPSPYGLPVTITATVRGADDSELFPTSGNVQFIVDGKPFGAPVELNAEGKASKLLPYTALWVGSHPITATYSGNGSFNASSELTEDLTQVVEKGNLTILVDYSVENPVFGQSFTITAEVEGNDTINPVPSGTIQFYVDQDDQDEFVALSTPVTLSNVAQATSVMVEGLTVGEHPIRIVYSGDDYYQSKTLDTAITVNKAESLVEIRLFDPEEVIVGEPVAVEFQVQAVEPGQGTPGGTVEVFYGDDSCSGTLVDGIGSCEVDLIPSHSGWMELSAVYSGDGSFEPSSNTSGDKLYVFRAPLEIELSVPDGPFVVGQTYTVTAQVNPVDLGTLIPVGEKVTIGNGIDSCEATIQADGSAACEITPTTREVKDFVAAFAGNDDFLPAESEPVSGPTINNADTQVSIATSLNPGVVGSEITFTAQVSVQSPGSGTPEGSIQFMLDDEEVGSPVTLVNGKASLMISDLDKGIHAVKAVYEGSDLFNSSTSAALSQKIVEGDHSSNVDPDEEKIIIYHGQQNGQPVSTQVKIPAGAMNEHVTVVYRQFEESDLTKPDGLDFVTHFVLEVYVDGELQKGYQLQKPIEISMTYNPLNWNEESFRVWGWQEKDIKSWQEDGIEISERDMDNDSITFTISGQVRDSYSLLGEHQYLLFFPVINR